LEFWLTDVEGGPLENKYELIQFHFHWGDTNSIGSEHVIGDKVFAAEVRLIVSRSVRVGQLLCFLWPRVVDFIWVLHTHFI